MHHIIDLTKKNFDRIDFTEAKIIDFYCQHTLPSTLEFKVWGATLLLSPMWKHMEKFDNSLQNVDDMYVSGEGIIKIYNLIGGSIEVYAYDNIRDANNHTSFAKNCDGSELVFRRDWQFDRTQEVDEYLWECAITWPYGYCNLRLYSNNGKVTYEFDSENMISTNEYRQNPLLYTFSEYK